MQCSHAVAFASLVGIVGFLSGCGDADSGQSSSSSTSSMPSEGPWITTPLPPPAVEPFTCESEVQITGVQQMSNKGLCIDDTSLFSCSDKLVQNWPHTDLPVSYVRLFKAFRPEDSEAVTTRARENFVHYVKTNNIKVLVGSQITCSEDDDDKDWGYVKLMLEALGKDHVLALAVGNELDLLHTQSEADCPPGCLDKIWGGHLHNQTISRIQWARDTLGNPDLPVTSVFTGGILWDFTSPTIFPDSDKVGLTKYLTQLFDSGEKNFVFVLNIYPIFDPTLKTDEGDDSQCEKAIRQTSCYDDFDCSTPINLQTARTKVNQFLAGNPAWGMQNAPLWIGEMGWSSPKMPTYDGAMGSCPAFWSKSMMHKYYKNFLQWDLTISPYNEDPPEMVFYFTMRDSTNFGNEEHFGLVESCESTSCKIVVKEDLEVPGSSTHTLLV